MNSDSDRRNTFFIFIILLQYCTDDSVTSPFSCLLFSSSSLWMKAVVSGAGPGSVPTTCSLVLKVSLNKR